MSSKKTEKKITKTDKIDGMKISRICRKFNVSPLDMRDLQMGYVVSMSKTAADELIENGLAKQTKEKLPTVRKTFTTNRTEEEKEDTEQPELSSSNTTEDDDDDNIEL